jgi:hypothetical protein
MKKVLIWFVFLSMVFCIAGCKHASYDDSAHTVVLSGTSACPDQAGVFQLTFNSSSDSVVTGTLTYDGEIYDLTGTYDAGTGGIEARNADADPQFVMTGIFASSIFNGEMIRTISEVETTCTLSGQEESDDGTVENYLGTFGFEDSDDGAGTWNMSIQDGVAVGTYARLTGLTGTFGGSVSGSSLTVDTFYVYDPDTDAFYDLLDVYPEVTGIATGTFSGSGISGSWSWEPEASGLFVGTLQDL